MDFDIQRIGIRYSLTWEGVSIVWRLWQKLDNGDSQGWQRILYNPFYIIHVRDWWLPIAGYDGGSQVLCNSFKEEIEEELIDARFLVNTYKLWQQLKIHLSQQTCQRTHGHNWVSLVLMVIEYLQRVSKRKFFIKRPLSQDLPHIIATV